MTIQNHQLIRFLQDDLGVPPEFIPSILKNCQNLNRLPVVLWQQKLVTIAELDRVIQWVEGHRSKRQEVMV